MDLSSLEFPLSSEDEDLSGSSSAYSSSSSSSCYSVGDNEVGHSERFAWDEEMDTFLCDIFEHEQQRLDREESVSNLFFPSSDNLIKEEFDEELGEQDEDFQDPEMGALDEDDVQNEIPETSHKSSFNQYAATSGINSGTSSATSKKRKADYDSAGETRSKKIFYRRSWTPEEDEQLTKLVQIHGAQHWSLIAQQIPGKTGNQCSQRWQKALDPSIVKGKWTVEEDQALRKAVDTLGFKWKQISKLIPGRTGKQCRDRYTSRLNPKLTLGNWTKKEELIALKAHRTYGNKWATIQKLLPNRSWYTIKWKIHCLHREGRR